MLAVFVLLPASTDLASLLGDTSAPPAKLHLRRYPRATDRAHLLSLVRDGRDPLATRWLRGTVLAIGGGGVLGALTLAALAHFFGMLGGLLGLALQLGFGIGAFLGGFTASMTGTQVARAELKLLAGEVQPGDVLLQWTGEASALVALADRCRAAGLRTTGID